MAISSWDFLARPPGVSATRQPPKKILGLVPGEHERKDDRHVATPDAAATTAQGPIPAAFLKEKRVLDDVAAAAAVAAV